MRDPEERDGGKWAARATEHLIERRREGCIANTRRLEIIRQLNTVTGAGLEGKHREGGQCSPFRMPGDINCITWMAPCIRQMIHQSLLHAIPRHLVGSRDLAARTICTRLPNLHPVLALGRGHRRQHRQNRRRVRQRQGTVRQVQTEHHRCHRRRSSDRLGFVLRPCSQDCSDVEGGVLVVGPTKSHDATPVRHGFFVCLRSTLELRHETKVQHLTILSVRYESATMLQIHASPFTRHAATLLKGIGCSLGDDAAICQL
mmetsp:Transcript_81750/g.234887  ORF Transcript_81750/g.234887 Transcript_81750/m.234887 type:complete len:259 (-) Transcript_81750:252-1028(-)